MLSARSPGPLHIRRSWRKPEENKVKPRRHARNKRLFAGPLSFPGAQFPVRLPEQIKLPGARVRAGDNPFFLARRSKTDSAASRTPSSTIALTIRRTSTAAFGASHGRAEFSHEKGLIELTRLLHRHRERSPRPAARASVRGQQAPGVFPRIGKAWQDDPNVSRTLPAPKDTIATYLSAFRRAEGPKSR